MLDRRLVLIACLAALAPSAVLGHHGWGSYDAAKTVTVEGPIEVSQFENPHALIKVTAQGKTWSIVLAPTSRMIARGAPAAFIAVGKTVTAVGYASTAAPGEMRAERITVEGKTVEMR
ncbi:MAG: DUF6152 family protein [Hyphomicrobiaceae bacterium]|nr:DUF6152 family protein [Hyphomicrobiaceae bacterium]